jgi:hypothetical protein
MAVFKELCFCVRFCVVVGESGAETFSLLQVASGEQTGGQTQVFELLSYLKSVLTSLEILNALYIHWQVKEIKCRSSEGSCPQKRESLYVNLLAYREFHVLQSRAFWKTVWLMLDWAKLSPSHFLAPPCLCLNFWLETKECYVTPSLPSRFTAV